MKAQTKKRILCISLVAITTISAVLPVMTSFAATSFSSYTIESSDNDPVDYEFANPKWSMSDNKAVATWIRSDKAQKYTLKLYWVYDGKTSLLTTVSTTQGKYDFSKTIKGNGSGTYYFILTGDKSFDSLTSERQEITKDQLKNLKNTGSNTHTVTLKDYVNPMIEPTDEKDKTLNSEYSKDKNNYNTVELKDKKSTFYFTPMGYIYYDKDGKVVSNGWKLISNNWYHFKNGFMEQNTWVHNYDGDRYVEKYGKLVVNGVTPDGFKVDEAGRKIP